MPEIHLAHKRNWDFFQGENHDFSSKTNQTFPWTGWLSWINFFVLSKKTSTDEPDLEQAAMSINWSSSSTSPFPLNCLRYNAWAFTSLLFPESNECKIDRLLAAIKRPFSYRIKELLIQKNNDLVLELTSKKNSGKSVFHFWQKGPGYDRNLSTKQAVENAINYIHLNPVKRKLSNDSSSWKWSSDRWYESDGKVVDPDLPQIHGLPWEFFEVQ